MLTTAAMPAKSQSFAGLLCDFDGTIHFKQLRVAAEVTDAIQQLPHPFGICTGRQFQFIQGYIDAHQIKGVHVVCGGAQLIGSDGTVYQERLIPAETMQAITEFVEQCGGYLLIKQTYATFANEVARTSNGKHRDIPMQPLDAITDWASPSFYVSGLADDHWQALAARDDITLHKQRFRSGKPGYFADGVASQVSKATGVGWWCCHNNIDPASVIGIGDGENDIGLFEAVGLKLAMGNAVPELKAIADEVIPSLDENGVAWAIDRYF